MAGWTAWNVRIPAVASTTFTKTGGASASAAGGGERAGAKIGGASAAAVGGGPKALISPSLGYVTPDMYEGQKLDL